MKPLTDRYPLQIEGDLDGATVRILTQPAPQEPFRWVWAVGMLAAGVMVLPWWGALVLLLLLCGAASYATVPRPEVVVSFTVDRLGVLFRGERVEGEVDYQVLRLGKRHFRISGGLTKREHEQLARLLCTDDLGEEHEVPQAMQALRE